MCALTDIRTQFHTQCSRSYPTRRTPLTRDGWCCRYDRELVRCDLSAVKHVLDGCPARGLVLCVAAVLTPGRLPPREPATPGAPRQTDGQTDAGPLLLLTDGWHSLTAALDAPLARLLQQGRITPGGSCQGLGFSKYSVCGTPGLAEIRWILKWSGYVRCFIPGI